MVLPGSVKQETAAGMDVADTTKMKNLADARREKARELLQSVETKNQKSS
jgi:hypothetical protein